MSDNIPPSDDPMRQQVLLQHGGPAFIRRARQVHEAFEDIVARCRAERDERLKMVRLRLATLADLLAEDWSRLLPWLADESQVELLRQMHQELQPKLLDPQGPTKSSRALRPALTELVESLERFNRRWAEYLPTVDLARVNALRESYNRFYLLEKECAVGRAGLTKKDFEKLPPLGPDDVAARLPLLPVPRLAR